ncbi:hypothetical protein TSAR_000523 [Trichomalopsis sarcophagae]|uniref:Mos1 transposase HTH domain-containing protein n=1 Tax=Trichomalopsis sarcophagae TaxID=543379 RepID=A0A232FIE0_9HYME|nr:hypothetical protein TSAR_000523 [Trichomalopsis sarcophagae]
MGWPRGGEWLTLLMMLLATCSRDLVGRCKASEFPERECCDPIYPLPEPTSRMPTLPTPTGGKSGEYIYVSFAFRTRSRRPTTRGALTTLSFIGGRDSAALARKSTKIIIFKICAVLPLQNLRKKRYGDPEAAAQILRSCGSETAFSKQRLRYGDLPIDKYILHCIEVFHNSACSNYVPLHEILKKSENKRFTPSTPEVAGIDEKAETNLSQSRTLENTTARRKRLASRA